MAVGRNTNARRNSDGEVVRRARQRAFLLAAGPAPPNGLPELKELLATAGAEVVGEATQVRATVHPDSYMGSGRAIEAMEEIKQTDANLVVCDDELSPRQERTLEKLLGMPVIDRTAVILDIFALHAGSAEGKLQVELAQLEYNLARMRGLWTHLERLGGGIGTRGPGESQLETDRRLARDRISVVRRRLGKVGSARARMRAERERSAVPSIALVGYTNAGKSTLMKAITGAEVGVRDELFHTRDPTTRTFEHRGRSYVATDTVGFIRKLPHQLVDAFAATLEETIRADLLLFIQVGSQDEEKADRQRESVLQTLSLIEADSIPRIDVLNKVDKLDAGARSALAARFPQAVQASAVTGDGVDHLLDSVAAAIRARLKEVELLIPHSEGRMIAELHRLAGDLEREDRPDGVHVRARLNSAQESRYRRFEVGAAS
ncbi:MAG: GTPase HflX [Actinomycetes bacterium]